MSKKDVRRTAFSVQRTASSVQHTACTVFLAAVMALPGSLHSQSTADLEAEVRRLEAEVILARQEEDSLQAARELSEMTRFVRVEAGGLRVFTVAELREQVEAAGGMAWAVLREIYQDSVAVPLRAFPISILLRPKEDSIARQVWYPSGTRLVFVTGDDDARAVAIRLLAQVIQELWLHQDEELRTWLKSPPGVTTDLSPAFSNAYLDLATSASPVAQRCLRNVRECLEALGLARPADPAREWYNPAGRRRLVLQLAQFFQVGESRPAFDRCVLGQDQACLTLLRGVPDLIPGSLLPPTRLTFLRVALENGGANSYPVLLASRGGSMLSRLQEASDGSVERSVAEWHRQVVAARPHPTSMAHGQTFAALGWSALLLGFALRSSRWR